MVKMSSKKQPLGFFYTWKEVMFNPLNFYKKLPDKIRYREPSIFLLKTQAIALAAAFVLLIFIFSFLASFFSLLSKLFVPFGLVFIIILLIGFPFLLLFSWGLLFVSAGILHLFVLLFGGKKGYSETLKVVAYSVAPNLFYLIPVVNYFVIIYSLILRVIGLHQRQKLSLGRSIAAVSLPLVISVILFLLFYFLFISLKIPFEVL